MLSIKVFALTLCLLVAIADAKSWNGRARSQSRAPRQSYQAQAPEDSYASAAVAGGSRGGGGSDEEANPAPEPYSFTYETTDEYGTTLTRSEEGDANGNVKGSYMYRDPEGIYRTVEYSDNGDGFNANVQTNEPGVESHKPANAEYLKN